MIQHTCLDEGQICLYYSNIYHVYRLQNFTQIEYNQQQKYILDHLKHSLSIFAIIGLLFLVEFDV